MNGDGYSDVIVGATGVDNGGENSGAAYVLLGSASGIEADCTIGGDAPCGDATIIGAAASDRFGISVSAGDFNGDGFDDVVVGAYNATCASCGEKGLDTGRAYVFLSDGAVAGIADCDLSESGLADTTITGVVAGAKLGMSVSAAGDVNGDGYADFVVGAVSLPVGDPTDLIGAAYYFLGSGAGIADCDLFAGDLADTTITGAASYDQLGMVK